MFSSFLDVIFGGYILYILYLVYFLFQCLVHLWFISVFAFIIYFNVWFTFGSIVLFFRFPFLVYLCVYVYCFGLFLFQFLVYYFSNLWFIWFIFIYLFSIFFLFLVYLYFSLWFIFGSLVFRFFWFIFGSFRCHFMVQSDVTVLH